MSVFRWSQSWGGRQEWSSNRAAAHVRSDRNAPVPKGDVRQPHRATLAAVIVEGRNHYALEYVMLNVAGILAGGENEVRPESRKQQIFTAVLAYFDPDAPRSSLNHFPALAASS